MKKILSVLLAMALLLAVAPAAFAAEDLSALSALPVRWLDYASVHWWDYESNLLLYEQEGRQGFLLPDGTALTEAVFDGVGWQIVDGGIPVQQGGKWGKIDARTGALTVDFLYGTAQETLAPVNAEIVGAEGGPYAVAALDGTPLSEYKYWDHSAFSYGLAAVFTADGWGYVDATGAEVIPCRYYCGGVEDFAADGYAWVNGPDGYNIVDRTGREVFDAPKGKLLPERPWRAGHGLWGFYGDNGLVGFVEADSGRIVVEPQYRIGASPKGMRTGGVFNAAGYAAVLDENMQMTGIDLAGRRVDVALAATDGALLASHSGGLHSFMDGGKFGYMDESESVVVPAVFDFVSDFWDGAALVQSGEVWGILSDPRAAAEPAETDALSGLDIAWVDTENRLIPLGADNLVAEYRELYRYGMMGSGSSGVDGLRNADGALILPVIYENALMPGARFIVAVSGNADDGSWRATDYLGRVFTAEDMKTPWAPPELDCSRAPGPDGQLESGKYCYADPWTGEIVLPAIYDAAAPFSDGRGVVRIGDDRFVIDREGSRVIDLNGWASTDNAFHGGLLRVQDAASGKYGYIDTAGELIIDTVWDDAAAFTEGADTAVVGVRADGENGTSALRYGIIDATGALLVPCVLEDTDGFVGGDGVAVLRYQGRQGILKDPRRKLACSDWAKDELAAADAAGYVTPDCAEYQTFTITRAQFAHLAVNFYEKVTGETISPAPADSFSDTQDECVRKAYSAGIVNGMGDGIFAPGMLLTREQLATMLWRAMVKAGKAAPEGADLSSFRDASAVSGWAQDALAALTAMGVMQGTGEHMLSPRGTCTVEQAVALVWRARTSVG